MCIPCVQVAMPVTGSVENITGYFTVAVILEFCIVYYHKVRFLFSKRDLTHQLGR